MSAPKYPAYIRMDVSRAWQRTGPVAQRALAPPAGAPFNPPRPSDQRGHSQSRAGTDPLPRNALSKDDGGVGKTLSQPLTSQTSIALPNPPVSLCPQARPQQAMGCPRGWSGAEAGEAGSLADAPQRAYSLLLRHCQSRHRQSFSGWPGA